MQAMTREYRPAVAMVLTAILMAAATRQAWAQPQGPADGLRTNENVFRVETPRSELQITEQFSRVFESPNRIVRVDGFDPDIITISALSPNRIRVLGERTGVTTLVMTDEFDNAYTIEVFVTGDVRHLMAYLHQLFPEDEIQAVKLNDSVVLTGVVTEPGHITQIMDVAAEFSTKVLNQMHVGGVHQVQLNTKVMEVQRTKLRRLGFNFLVNSQSTYINSSPGKIVGLSGLSTPIGGPADVTLTGLNNSTVQFAIMGASEVFNGFIDALRNENLLKILAEPKLVTTSGRPATILSGGEFPILVPQSLGTTTIEYREFGVRLEAVPVVLGNGRLRLDVAPEVSERDFSNSVTVNGFVVPGITTRRVNTQVEMRFGETLMIGGLISSRKAGSTNKIPFLGELPWIGTAFRTVHFEDTETELMIIVTPHMVAPLQPHQVPPLGPGQFTDDPTDRELYLDGMLEVPLYGPECEGCQTGGPYPGGFGYGGDVYGPTPVDSGQNGLMLPLEEGQIPDQSGYAPSPQGYSPEGLPVEGNTYESSPPGSQLPASEIPSDSGAESSNASPTPPALPGQVETTSGSNLPASLGLINPFRTQVRTGESSVETQTRRLDVNATSATGSAPLRAASLFRPRQDTTQTASSGTATK